MTKQAVAFDIDGTLFNDDKKVSKKDYETLKQLGNRGITRIAATGRNLLSIQRLLPNNFPIDFAVFSSGAGIINWKTKEIVFSQNLNKEQIDKVIAELLKQNLYFIVKEAIPDSHNMHYLFYNDTNNDLFDYISNYHEFCTPIDFNKIPQNSTQIIALINEHKHLYDSFVKSLSSIKTVLTTSPINNKSLWLEFFHPNVSKSNGIKWILDKNKIKPDNTMCIGNDYNDRDMLLYFTNSYVVNNAPNELKSKYIVVESNNKSGFSTSVEMFLSNI